MGAKYTFLRDGSPVPVVLGGLVGRYVPTPYTSAEVLWCGMYVERIQIHIIQSYSR